MRCSKQCSRWQCVLHNGRPATLWIERRSGRWRYQLSFCTHAFRPEESWTARAHGYRSIVAHGFPTALAAWRAVSPGVREARR